MGTERLWHSSAEGGLAMTKLTAILMGDETLTRHAAEIWLQRGHALALVVTSRPSVADWAKQRGIRVERAGRDLDQRLGDLRVDWLLSVANLELISKAVLERATQGAVNFHDGPLPEYAGLNVPVWALLAGVERHGITWHLIEGGVDEGDVLEQRFFDLSPDETALSLNTRCFEAGLESFPAVVAQMENGLRRQPQDLSRRQLYLRDTRPSAFGRLNFQRPAEHLARLVRALDHGQYWNPLATPKIATSRGMVNVASAEVVALQGSPGQVLRKGPDGLLIACGADAILMSGFSCGAKGLPLDLSDLADDILLSVLPEEERSLNEAQARLAKTDAKLRQILRDSTPLKLPQTRDVTAGDLVTLPIPPHSLALLSLAAWRAVGGEGAGIALRKQQAVQGYSAGWSPLIVPSGGNLGEALQKIDAQLAGETGDFALDLRARDRDLAGKWLPDLGISLDGAAVEGAALTLTDQAAIINSARLDLSDAQLWVDRILSIAGQISRLSPDTELRRLPRLSEADYQQIIHDANQEVGDHPDHCVHEAFEAQVRLTPDAEALAFEGQSFTYAALNARANQAAHLLRQMGVEAGQLVGLHLRRCPEMVIGALAILKAGGAYVPMDPAYPADRTALYIEDSQCRIIVTQSDLQAGLPTSLKSLCLDSDLRLPSQPRENLQAAASPADLAYVIYTSGSTGRPKGVMVEHRNVVNFFSGMDRKLGREAGVWLAVTSLSFDISVLELFWTLSRGYKLVLSSDEDRALVAGGRIRSARSVDFSLYYWGNDDGAGPKKYELLLEGAKFADRHGFTAIWTPERHFHAFGGPYPNPAVTGAAVAAVTRNLAVRAGSCVVPLHHPARIAEEWAVIDNLTNGRAGIAIASGWQPEDFVLRPENTPPANKAAMFEAADQLRRLWRGEGVDFPMASGEMFSVRTQPRPVSAELPLWVTTAGNPETWREAGRLGANVLTHLLGQSIEEVAEKISLYRKARHEAGFDPEAGQVTLMLHSFIASSREEARRQAEAPMKAYLAAAVGLVKQYAWAFPAFKKPQGVSDPMQIDLRSLSDAENAAILDFAFQRYFEDSGLFGTVDDALARVEQLKRIGVGEVACLIDFGIAPDVVMAGLHPLAEVVARANLGQELAEDDYSIAAQLVRHGVSHLQCTPSMARMIAMNDDSRIALGGVGTLLLGGEALSGGQVADLRKASKARILNMYGPTETTIWSSAEDVGQPEATVNIGKPLVNQQLYVLDDHGQPVPMGREGELWIGGDGVTRGYWQRPDLTEERFRPDPFVAPDKAPPWGARMYRTGDLVRRRGDGKLDFLGRADHQVKLRGYRIELGEIEAVLEAQPSVRQAVVLVREDSPGDLRLVAYLAGPDRYGLAETTLKQAVATVLPEHMRPVHYVVLQEFPLTPNRKVDRKALPLPQLQDAPSDPVIVDQGDADEVQAKIAAVWCKVLGLRNVSGRDNFFALGGHSLLAVQAHREISLALGTGKLSITDIFRFPTLQGLAAHLGGNAANDVSLAAPKAAALQAFAQSAASTQAQARQDAMSRRRQMRAAREG